MMKILRRSSRLVAIPLTRFAQHQPNISQAPLGAWQAKCWDPKVGSTAFDEFCEMLGKPFGIVSAANMELPFGHPNRMVSLGKGFALDIAIINYGKWIKEVSYSVVSDLDWSHALLQHVVSRCPSESSVEEVTRFTKRYHRP